MPTGALRAGGEMSQTDDHFEEFRGHTRFKHYVLQSYLKTWAFKLLQPPLLASEVVFVDAFAGEGRDQTGNDGSPLIAGRVATEVAADLQMKGISGRMVVFAIESDPKRYQRLLETVTQFRASSGTDIDVRSGQLADHIDEICDRFHETPKLFFLDPFGIKGLDASTYQRALTGPRDELFALFADQGAARHFGVLTADGRKQRKKIEALRESPSLFPENDAADLAAAEDEFIAYKWHVDMTRPHSYAALQRALGGDDWVETMQNAEPNGRGEAFLHLFMNRMQEAGARKILPIPVRGEANEYKYSLVHSSKSDAGYLAMKECVSAGLRKPTLPPEVQEVMRQSLTVDLEAIYKNVCRLFAGQTVGWTDVVRPYVLANTAMFDFQAPDFKTMLSERGHTKGRKIMCEFPLSTT